MKKALGAIFLVFVVVPLALAIVAWAEDVNRTDSAREPEKTNETGRRKPGDVVLIQINGNINPATLDYIRVGLEEAQAGGASALVIEMDTPGGLLTSTKEIVKLLLNSRVPVVVYVSPSGASATSAGVFITLSANIAAMAPGTSIGAAHPVSIGKGDQQPDKKEENGDGEGDKSKEKKGRSQDDIMGEKIVNYASSFIQSIAEQRGRNVEWAVDAVRNSSSITANEALEINVIDIISPSLTELLTAIDGKEVKTSDGVRILNTAGASVKTKQMSAKQKLVDILSTPDIAFLLLSLGSLGLLLEFYNPGLIFPGVAGVVCLLMGFVSFQILPFNYAGLMLLLLAIALFVAEVYVTSFGLLSLGGIISFALGALLLFDTPESDVRVSFDMVIAVTAAFGLFFIFVAFYLVKAQRLAPKLGFEGMIGEHGEAFTDIDRTGKVYLMGEFWDAESEERISKGDRIEVVESIEGMRLRVKKI